MVDTIVIDNELNDDWMKTLPGYKDEVALIEQAGRRLSEKPVVVTLKDIHGDQQSGVMVAFFIPSDAASTIAIDKDVIPGAEVIPPNGLHITLVYLGDISEFPYESDRQRVRAVVGTFAQSHAPLKGVVNGIGQFANATDGKQPFYANFDSPALPDFRQELVEALELNGVTVSKNHGFTPHITLAYIPEGYATKLPDIPTISIVFDALYLSMGEEDMAYSLGRSKSVVVTLKGGPGSGHRGHSGRPGKRGGSAAGVGGEGKINSVSNAYWDKKSRLGNVTINNHSVQIGLSTVGYRDDGFTPIEHLSVEVAHDYNRTGRFIITAPGLKSLVSKLVRYKKGKLVEPG